MDPYDHRAIEAKWQKRWLETGANQATFPSTKPKYYCLIEFPYPSGEGLHVGHIRSNTAMDIIARKRRAEGFNVIYPIGWDAFGLPTENYAIKTGIQPAVVTQENTDTFRRQLQALGFSFDWSREINTTDPEYYRWTQWIFLQFYKKGLAYKKKIEINWCPKCLIGLANEEVVAGACERCGTPVERREKDQWLLAITKYADRLEQDLDQVDYLEPIKIQQRNWIGRSEGAEFEFPVVGAEQKIKVFTTRADTLFGVTFLAISPTVAKQLKLEFELPQAGEEEKVGVDTGLKAVNPATGEAVPVWVTNYVLDEVGTGAVMGVPAHDERDFDFAKKYNLPIKEIELESKEEMIKKFGQAKVNYKLRDWVFSRQRYWGEPIPMVYCEKDGWQAVPEDQLPITLPPVERYQPTETGESPLANISDWVQTTCPKCGGPARRETDTMPNWAGSSWYYLRYCDPGNKQTPASAEALKYFTPVDWYNGGMEHTTLHLLYSRFWHKFLFDLGVVPTGEPYQKRTSHGLILAENGEKMSKSRGNVVNPDQIVERYGADTLRVYEMFMGPFDQAIAWSPEGLMGPRRFLEKVWRLASSGNDSLNSSLTSLLHETIKKVSEDIEQMKFNTAVSALMVLANQMDQETPTREQYQVLLRLLAPFAPHLTEELWTRLGETGSIHEAAWPVADQTKIIAAKTIVVQVNGVKRGQLEGVGPESGEAEITALALALPAVEKHLAGREPKRVIYVAGRLLNFVV